MRTREEILAAAASADAQSKASHLAVLEVLLDVRDELVTQGKPTEVSAPPEPVSHRACMEREHRLEAQRDDALAGFKQLEGELAFYRKADHGLARVGKLVGVDTSGVFAIDDVVAAVQRQAERAGLWGLIMLPLSTYLGCEDTPTAILAAVRELGSLAQDRKDELDRVSACVSVCAELVKLLAVPDHTHLRDAVRNLQAALNDARARP